MPNNGFRIDEVDYAFAGNKTMGLDSLWTLAIWGQDLETTDYYYVTAGVNGAFYPFEMAEVTDDIYFSGNVINGFPIATLMQYSQMRKLYGDCAKYLETGDVVTLKAMTLSKDFYDYLILNQDVETAAAEFNAIISAEQCRFDPALAEKLAE